MKTPVLLKSFSLLIVALSNLATYPAVFRTEIEEANVNDSSAQREAFDLRMMESDAAAAWGEALAGLQMGIRFDRDTFSIGEPIVAHLIVRNVGDRHAVYPGSVPDEHSVISVIDESGRAMPHRPTEIPNSSFGQRLGRANVRAFNYGVRPGWQRRYDLRLDTLFDLTKPGAYSINVSRPVWPTNNTTGPLVRVASGNVLIHVVEGVGAVASNGSRSSARPPIQDLTKGNPATQNSVSQRLRNQNAKPLRNNSADATTSSDGNASLPLANASPPNGTSHFSSSKWIGATVVATLLALLLAILWRASRRKRV